MSGRGGVNNAAAIRPVRSAKTVSSWPPMTRLVTSLFGTKPFFCTMSWVSRSTAPPRDEIPTNLPFKSAMERMSLSATMSNCGLAEAMKTSLTGMPRTAAAMVEPDAEEKADRAAEQGLHADGTADEDDLDVEPFFAVKALDLGDAERHLGDGGSRDEKRTFFNWRERR